MIVYKNLSADVMKYQDYISSLTDEQQLKFLDENKLWNHHPVHIWKCSKCQDIFLTKQEFRKHKTIRHAY